MVHKPRRALGALIIGLLLGCSIPAEPAFADAPPVPDQVITWLEESAPTIIKLLSENSSSDYALNFPAGSIVGGPITIMVWDDTFLKARKPSSSMLMPRGDWIAPIISEGKPVGTILFELSPEGEMGYQCDDNAEIAGAVMAMKRGDIAASDGPNGMFIITGDSARQVGLSRVGIESATGSLVELRAALVEWKAAIDREIAANNGEMVYGTAPLDFGAFLQGYSRIQTSEVTGNVGWLVGVAVIAVATLGALIVIARRRTA
jgi:roadblock/LC7 domain-containing protein